MFFETLGAKDTVNTDVFCASEAQDQYLRCFFVFGSKNHGIYSIFWLALSSFQHVARSIVSMPKAKPHYKLQSYGSWHAQKVTKMDLPNPTWQEVSFLPMLRGLLPQKRKNTTRGKDSGGGSAAEAATGSAMLQRLAAFQEQVFRKVPNNRLPVASKIPKNRIPGKVSKQCS